MQHFTDFEIIVCDNASTDNTVAVVNSFHDKRITLFTSAYNIGFAKNVKKSMMKARGTYVVCLGDDDYFNSAKTLFYLYSYIQDKKPGYLHLHYHLIKHNRKHLPKGKNTYLSKNRDPYSIITFLENSAVVFISGSVFKNEIQKTDFLQCEQCPWIPLAHKLSQKYGAAYISKFPFMANWSYSAKKKYHFFLDENNRVFFEAYFKYVLSVVIDKNNKDLYRKKFMEKLQNPFMEHLTSVKFSTDNEFVSKYMKQLILLLPELIDNLPFRVSYVATLILPHFMIRLARNIKNRL